jgi:hypothetical protein
MGGFGSLTDGSEPSRSRSGVEHVELRMPVEPALWPLAREVVNVIAARAHLSTATVDDLRIAVSELCTLCAADLDWRSTIALSVDLDLEQISVECRAISDFEQEFDPTPPLIPDQYLERILDEVVDEHGIEEIDGSRRGWIRRHAVT